MDSVTFCRQLLDLIAQEILHAQDLLEGLSEERNALAARPERVEQLAEEKQRQIDALEELNRRRASLLHQAGFNSDRNGMDAALRANDTSGNVRSRWDELLSLVEECRTKNQVNGAVLANSRNSIRHALAVLHGQVLQTDTYSRTGTTSDPTLSRSWAKA